MSFGRSSNQRPQPTEVRPEVTRFEFNTPGGDQIVADTRGRTQRVTTNLSPTSQRVVNRSQREVDFLTASLAQPDADRERNIRQRNGQLFESLGRDINTAADDAISRVRSDSAQRFGGALNSTFGANQVARLEEARGRQLSDARLQTELAAEEQLAADETRRINRLGVFQNVLEGLDSRSRQLGSLGSNTLDRSRSLANQRAQALDRIFLPNTLSRQNSRRRSFASLGSLIGGPVGGSFLGVGGQEVGSQLGSALGESFL